jgi:hypothetical protein
VGESPLFVALKTILAARLCNRNGLREEATER